MYGKKIIGLGGVPSNIKTLQKRGYNIVSFAKNKKIAEYHAEQQRKIEPINKGDKTFIKIEKIHGGDTYVVLVKSIYSKKTQKLLDNFFSK